MQLLNNMKKRLQELQHKKIIINRVTCSAFIGVGFSRDEFLSKSITL